MDRIRRALDVLKTRPGRKLTIVSVLITILIAIILFLGSFLIVAIDEVLLLEGSISALPSLMQERTEELKSQYDVYKNDYVARGELATIFYNESSNVEMNERLELVRTNVDALNVTVLNNEGGLVASTAGGQPSVAVTAAFAAINADEGSLYDPNAQGINEKLEDEDGYVPETDSMPMVYDGRTNDGNILMVEFDYTSFGQVLLSQNAYTEVCKRALAGMEGLAFVRFEDGIIDGYQSQDLTDEEKEQVSPEVQVAFDQEGVDLGLNLHEDFDTTYSLGTILGRSHLLVKLPASALGAEFMLAIPVDSFVRSMVMCDVALIVLVVVGYALFSRFATRSFRQHPDREKDKRAFYKKARKQTRTGAMVMIVATGVLATMLLMLEGMSNTAKNTITQRESITYEADYRSQRKSGINKEYSKRYTTRASALAYLLSEHPELRTRETLQRMSDAIQVEYLMLLDKNGNELFSSNSYTGFSINDEKSGALEEWRPVLQGYSQVETPTKKNEVTGKYERTVATLVTDKTGVPEGVLVMAVDDDAYMEEIGDASLEGVVKNYATSVGQVAAVIGNETGEFVAHTKKEMIGEKAENYIDKAVIGRDYEGYTEYDGASVYVSGISSEGKTTIVITESGTGDGVRVINWYMVIAILVLMLLIYYPAAASLCAKYARLRPDNPQPKDKSHPMMLFYHGYVAYIAVLALLSLLGFIFGFWDAFGYVYSARWTHGIHLFSVWSALFIFSCFSYITSGLHRIIRRVDENVNPHTRTYARLVDSLVTYVITILMVILILTVLGVDTATIIGSVSIISIAIGMGTQDLVKDIVAGLFLIFEGTISVGDIVEIGGWRGRVTDMGVRTTEITNDSNDVKILANSKIGDVINLSKVKTACAEEFVLPRTVEVEDLPKLVKSYIAEVVEEVPEIKSSLKLDEITSITEESYTVRLSYLVNEADRESVTIRLRNQMLLVLESETEDKAEDKS